MQFPLSASAGFEQRVKSERIWGMALFPGLPHSSGLETMTCSLMAKSAYIESEKLISSDVIERTQAPAQSGVAFEPLDPHDCLELCTIALHKTVVVYRA